MEQEEHKKYNEEINAIIISRKEFIDRNYLLVRDAYQNDYDWEDIDPLRHEIALALIFGLAQSAITLTNHFLESLLKYSLIFHDSKMNKSATPEDKKHLVESLVNLFTPARKKYSSENLIMNIINAHTFGIITDDERDKLHQYRKEYRNAYSHSDKSKTFGGRNISAQGIRIKEDKFILGEKENPFLAELPIGQGLAQAMQAQGDAVSYFLYMDGLARRVVKRLFKKTTTRV
jgi:hypothetical protein